MIILNIEPKTFIVFQTAYEEYALDAFKKGGMGYLLKPVEDIELKKTLQKISLYKEEKVNSSKKILGKVSDKIYLVEIDEIFYIKADLEKEAFSLIEDITDKMSELITRAKYSVITYYYDELFNRTVDEYLNDKKISEEKIDAIIEILKNYYVGVLFVK